MDTCTTPATAGFQTSESLVASSVDRSVDPSAVPSVVPFSGRWHRETLRPPLSGVVRTVLGLAVTAVLAGLPAALTAQTPLPTIESKTESMDRINGFMPLYWDDDAGTLWMEIDRWDTDIMHAAGIGAGLGSNDLGIDRGAGRGSRVVRFHRVGRKVMMVQPNYKFQASSNSASEKKAVTDAFAPSTLWGFTAGAKTGSRILVDLTSFLLRDAAGFASRMRPGSYSLDVSRSAVYMPMTMNFPENTELEVSLTFKLSGAAPNRFGGGGGALEGVGQVAATAEAATLRLHHSFIQLPELDEFTRRTFDSRSGVGSVSFQDYSAPLGEDMTQRFARRHRLEKRNPSAAMSEAIEPIIYYLDPGTPEPIRGALLDGARWWNEAFEAAGFINGFQVEIRPDDVSSHDVRYNVINWVHRSTRGWSTGGGITDPRTGEILKGAVTLGSLRVRQDYMIAEGLLAPYINGDEDPTEISEWALARIRQLAAHEVGHTLGLGHNYYNSDRGRISVMDYPHPLVALENGRITHDEVYDVGIGAWDKTAIEWAYTQFSAGSDEESALAAVLNDAWDNDVLYLSNQDASTHARVDQWANGTDSGAELNRMLDIRRFAMDRFGEQNIRTGRPMATMEEVLVPLYMYHRFQVTSAASVLGGLNYIYSFRGDGRDPVSPASASLQRSTLAALVRTLQPSELTIPESVLDDLPPRPSGYRGSRELFPRYTGSAFDAISPATVAASHTVNEIMNPARAARILQQNVVDSSLPGLGEVLDALVAVGKPQGGDSSYEAEIRRTVNHVVMNGLMGLASGAAMPQVRAVAGQRLETLRGDAQGLGRGSNANAAHFAMVAADIQRFQARPAAPWMAPSTPAAPPGAPIGQPAQEWLGGATQGAFRSYQVIPEWGQAWLDTVVPACTWDVR